jgi:hypothetical protein
MPKYLLLLHESANAMPPDISPEDIQAIIQKYQAWNARMKERGALLMGEKLRDGQGKVLRRQGGKIGITDGPYSEAKEVVGGLYMLQAKSYDDAVEMARSCPHIDFGTIEIREIEPT